MSTKGGAPIKTAPSSSQSLKSAHSGCMFFSSLIIYRSGLGLLTTTRVVDMLSFAANAHDVGAAVCDFGATSRGSARNRPRRCLRSSVGRRSITSASIRPVAGSVGCFREPAIGFLTTRNLVLGFFFAGSGALLGRIALQEMSRLAGFAGRALGRIATDLGLQLHDVDELVGLTA